MLKINQVQCKKCGDPIPVDNKSSVIKCESCGTIWKYDPSIQVFPELLIIEEKKSNCYQLRNNCFLGRNVNGYLTIISELDNTYKHCTTVRNPYIGKQHARIELKDVTEFVKIGTEDHVLERKKCVISDCLSKNGTAVNGEMLGPNQKKELKDGDTITLAPTSSTPLNVKFRNPL